MKKFEKEFRSERPETIGEKDKEFDNQNYIEWLEQKISVIPVVTYCIHEKTEFQKIRCNICLDCGEIIESDV
jgi:hypothetical protein